MALQIYRDNTPIVISPEITARTVAITVVREGVPGQDGSAGATGPAGPNTISTATTTALSGLLKGNGTNVAVSTAGTDYLTPTGNGSGLTGIISSQITDASDDGNSSTDGKVVLFNGSGGITTTGASSSFETYGDAAGFRTYGLTSGIATQGAEAEISTFGASAKISTQGENAQIYTAGAFAGIYTTGENATITTSGASAHIETTGGANIITSGTFVGNGAGITGLKQTRYFADASEQAAATPDFEGQFAYNTDLGTIFTAYGTAVGEWSNTFIFDYATVSNNAVINGTLAVYGGITGTLTGNAATATALQTARTINGTAFNGTANITVTVPVASGITGLGTGVATALAVNIGTAGAAVINGGALGTPSSGTVTNLTGTASININGTVGAVTPTTGAFTAATASTSIQSPTHIGATTASGTLTLQSTSNATKGKILFGTSAYDEVNNRMGIGTASPVLSLHLINNVGGAGIFRAQNQAANGYTGFELYGDAGTQLAAFGTGNSTAGFFPGEMYLGTNTSKHVRIYANGAANVAMSISPTLEVGIGTLTPSTKAVLDLTSTTKGLLLPRMTTTQRDAITSVPAGLTIYNTTTNKLNFYNGSAWEAVVSA